MNVLFMAPFPPLPESSGSRMRAMTVLHSLAGHNLFLVAFCGVEESMDPAALRKIFAEVHVFSPPKIGLGRVFINHFSFKPLLAKRFFLKAVRKKIRQLVRERHIDLVIAETLLMAEYFRGLTGPRLILDEHNLEYIRAARRIPTACNGFKKFYYYLIMQRLRYHELKVVNAVDICLTCSAEDAATIGRWCPDKRIMDVPNSIDTSYFQPVAGRQDPRRIVFTGTMWYEPNVDAMRFFCRKILPVIRQKLADVALIIVGDKPTAEVFDLGRESGITVTGFVPDIRPFLAEASVFVAPLRMGSGTRLKILGAMAMGVPVVSTSIGAEGICVQNGMNISIADTVPDFADSVLRILCDPVWQKKLAAGGRKLVLEKYSSQIIDRQLHRLWREIGLNEEVPCGI
ncbi:MAG: glycosyltransferase [Candidatus Aminicenantes bacterium]|nr:glycosyltransferase [Candidatus Aminicenantes bacterium]